MRILVHSIALVLALVYLDPNLLFASTAIPSSELVEREVRIVQLYSNDHCDSIRTMVASDRISDYRGNIIAIIAYCEIPNHDSEKLFDLAEAKDPNGDLVLVLHALYRWKKDKASADPLWQRVLILGRNPYLVQMAREYLDGTISQDDKPENLSLKSYTLFGDAEVGGLYSDNPRDPNFTQSASFPSMGALAKLNLSGQHWYRFGSVSADYNFFNDRFFSSHEGDHMNNSLDFPVALRLGVSEDLVFKPFGAFTTVANAPYQSIFGIAVMGVIYRSMYKQSVTGSISQEYIYPQALQTQEGQHYHFDYSFDFFPPSWFLNATLFVEHFDATDDVVDGIASAITNSHSDVGLKFSVQYDFKKFSIGIDDKLYFRDNTNNSTYLSPTSGLNVTKRRQDFQHVFRPNVTIPLWPYTQLIVWGEVNYIYSTYGPTDYADYNFLSKSAGLSLRAFMSTY